MSSMLAAVGNATAAWAPDPVATAGVHATVISVITTVVLAFAAFVYERRDAYRSAAIERVLRVNELPVPGFYGIAFAPEVDSSDPAVRRRLVLELLMIVAMPAEQARRADPVERGRRILQILVTLTTHYPFASPHRIDTKRGRHLKPTRLEVATREEAEAWVQDVEELYGALWFALTTFENSIRELLDAYRASRQEDVASLPNFDWDDILKELPVGARQDALRVIGQLKRAYVEHSSEVFGTIRANLDAVREVAREARRDIERSHLYERTHPGWPEFVIASCMTGAAFLAGVIIPIAVAEPPFWVYVVVPTVFYILAFGYISWRILREGGAFGQLRRLVDGL